MSAASTLKLKVECLLDGKVVNFVQLFAPSDLVSTVLQVAATQFSLNPSEWNVCSDQGGTQVLDPSTTLEFNRYTAGKKLFLGKVTAFSAHDYGFFRLHAYLYFFFFCLQIGGQKMVSVAVVDSSAPAALPPLDPVDVLLNQEQCVRHAVP